MVEHNDTVKSLVGMHSKKTRIIRLEKDILNEQGVSDSKKKLLVCMIINNIKHNTC